jgi:hypothetical protein
LRDPVRCLAAVRANFALTFFALLIVTTQVPVPEHAPDQPMNFEPDFADTVSVTTAPATNACVQVDPHEIPAGVLLTCPLPVPALATVRSLVLAKVAVAARAVVIET